MAFEKADRISVTLIDSNLRSIFWHQRSESSGIVNMA